MPLFRLVNANRLFFQLHHQHGPVASFWFGPQFCVSVGSASAFKDIQNLFDLPSMLISFASLFLILSLFISFFLTMSFFFLSFFMQWMTEFQTHGSSKFGQSIGHLNRMLLVWTPSMYCTSKFQQGSDAQFAVRKSAFVRKSRDRTQRECLNTKLVKNSDIHSTVNVWKLN